MKKQAAKLQYTIRGITPELDRALRSKAKARNKSLNQVILEELSSTIGGKVRADFSDLVGRWTPDPEFDDILSSQRQIDPEKWK